MRRILESGVVAVLRAERGERLVAVAEALLEGGVEVIEVTFTVPGAVRVIEQVADKLGDRIVLGAGTVLDAESARAAQLARRFLVSPCVRRDVIEIGLRYATPVAAGALTPTEVLGAWEAGASLVKVFPCDVFGPGYLKTLRGPLPQVKLLPTGGIDLGNAADYLRAGAAAIGVGSSLVPAADIENEDYDAIRSRAAEFADIVRRERG